MAAVSASRLRLTSAAEMSAEGTGTWLKARPEDFLVRENSLVTIVDESEASHHYFLLRKCGFTTLEAIDFIAKAAGVLATDISYSGLKDEDAITEQLIALPISANLDPASIAGRTSKETNQWLRVAHYGYGSKPLQIGYLAGNTFHVLLRMIEPPAAETLKLQRTINLVFLNYYDLQRFGVPGQPKVTHKIGDAILSQRWREALDLVVEARAPESTGAAAWIRAPEEFFASLDPRLTNFYLAATSSHSWNKVLFDLTVAEGDASAINATTDGLSFSFLNSSKHVMAFSARHCDIPYTRFSYSDGKCVPHSLTRPASIQTIIQVGSITADDLNPGRCVASLGFALPAGSYGTMALRQMVHFMGQVEPGSSSGLQ